MNNIKRKIWQFFMYVIVWQIGKNTKSHTTNEKPIFRLGRLSIWKDDMWLYHGFWGRLSRRKRKIQTFFRRAKSVWELLKLRWSVGFAEVQLKLSARRLEQIERKLLLAKTELSLEAYLSLQEAGFRISYSELNEIPGFAIYRFYWDGQVMVDACDIDMVESGTEISYHSVSRGRSILLGKYPK